MSSIQGKYGLASKGWKNRFEDKDVNPVGEEQNVKAVDLHDQLSEEEVFLLFYNMISFSRKMLDDHLQL